MEPEAPLEVAWADEKKSPTWWDVMYKKLGNEIGA
jgi:hypothetical protein